MKRTRIARFATWDLPQVSFEAMVREMVEEAIKEARVSP